MIRALARLVWFVLRRSSGLALSLGLLGAILGVALTIWSGPSRGVPLGSGLFWILGFFQLGLVLGFETAFEPEPDETFGKMLCALPGALLLALPGFLAWGAACATAAPALSQFMDRRAAMSDVVLLVMGLPATIAWSCYGLLPFACALRARSGLLEAMRTAGRIRAMHRVGFLLAAAVPFLAFYLTAPEIIAATEQLSVALSTDLGAIRVIFVLLSAIVGLVLGPAGAVAAQALFARIARKMDAPKRTPTTSPSPS